VKSLTVLPARPPKLCRAKSYTSAILTQVWVFVLTTYRSKNGWRFKTHPFKGVTKMIGWPFSKSEDDGSDEENRHWASSEEDCFRDAKEVWMGPQKSLTKSPKTLLNLSIIDEKKQSQNVRHQKSAQIK
jgi:hypothetical protein